MTFHIEDKRVNVLLTVVTVFDPARYSVVSMHLTYSLHRLYISSYNINTIADAMKHL